MRLQQFIRSYWNYFLELEEQLIGTKRFVDFDRENRKTFSIEYLKLLQATCSEIDVVAKMMAEKFDVAFKNVDNKNIQKWGLVIQKSFPAIGTVSVLFNNDYTVIPWENWEYETHLNSKGNMCYRLKQGKSTPSWWTAYNKVKHERTSPYKNGKTNYVRASLENLVAAMAGLFVLESMFIQYLVKEQNEITYEKSRLFSIEE